jgi:acylphosphatase
MTGRHVFYEGRVQGVGFRFTCKQIARGYEVVGWVRNLPDGRVELQCSGDAEEVEAFLQGIIESELASHIKDVKAAAIAPLAGARGFEILHG